MPIADAEHAPKWLRGEGRRPTWHWAFRPDGLVAASAHAKETGETYVLDDAGHLYRVSRGGQLAGVNRPPDDIQHIAWADDGSLGAAIVGERGLMTITQELKVRWTVELPDDILAIAVDPHGHYVIASLADGGNLIYSLRRRKVAAFSTIRPIAHWQFLCHEPLLIGAAEHGLLCCHTLGGERIWEEKILSTCGSMASAGDGRRTLMASFTHGVQVFDEIGETVGAYMVEGASSRCRCSYTAERMLALTLERQAFWMDEDGDILWTTTLPEDPLDGQVDPLGDWAMISMPGEGVCKFGWD